MAHTTLDVLLARLAVLDARVKALESYVSGGAEKAACYDVLQASMRKLDNSLKKAAAARRDAQGSA